MRLQALKLLAMRQVDIAVTIGVLMCVEVVGGNHHACTLFTGREHMQAGTAMAVSSITLTLNQHRRPPNIRAE